MKSTKFYLSNIVLSIVVLLCTIQAHAQPEDPLELLGQGTYAGNAYNLIYDSRLDITWFDFTYTSTSWDNANGWAGALSVTFGVNTYDEDWRLPITDTTCPTEANCTNSEMGHLYYTDLGGSENNPPINNGVFENLNFSFGSEYWTGTEDSTTTAWYFLNNTGEQFTGNKTNGFDALAVRNGRAVAPEPISSTLFIVGGATLGFRRFRNKLRK